MRTDLSDEQVATRGRVGWGAVSQARDGLDGLKVDRRDSLGEDDEDGISRWLLSGNDARRKSFHDAFCGPSAGGHPSARASLP